MFRQPYARVCSPRRGTPRKRRVRIAVEPESSARRSIRLRESTIALAVQGGQGERAAFDGLRTAHRRCQRTRSRPGNRRRRDSSSRLHGRLHPLRPGDRRPRAGVSSTSPLERCPVGASGRRGVGDVGASAVQGNRPVGGAVQSDASVPSVTGRCRRRRRGGNERHSEQRNHQSSQSHGLSLLGLGVGSWGWESGLQDLCGLSAGHSRAIDG